MFWLWLTLGILLTVLILLGIFPTYIILAFRDHIIRIFQEKPLFSSPKGVPIPDAEDLRFRTSDGLVLAGCYFKTRAPRRGVILFGLEFGSNRWAASPYCEFLREKGYDIFTFEMRGQGDSPAQESYNPLQWVTNYEVRDFEAALAYLKSRPDRDERGIGFFGFSKGGSAGLIAAAHDPFIRCAVVDGVFATHLTMMPYMKKWLAIYTKRPWISELILPCYYRWAARLALRKLSRKENCEFPHLEEALPAFAPRPLLMIHGGADTYIKPFTTRKLFRLAGEPKELWMVEGAKHNQAFHMANGQYQKRVLDFFNRNLAAPEPAAIATMPAPPTPIARAAIRLSEPAGQQAS